MNFNPPASPPLSSCDLPFLLPGIRYTNEVAMHTEQGTLNKNPSQGGCRVSTNER
jgi:hypothetical protein